MVETDERELEKARIERLIKEREPLAVVKWDESRAPGNLSACGLKT